MKKRPTITKICQCGKTVTSYSGLNNCESCHDDTSKKIPKRMGARINKCAHGYHWNDTCPICD